MGRANTTPAGDLDNLPLGFSLPHRAQTGAPSTSFVKRILRFFCLPEKRFRRVPLGPVGSGWISPRSWPFAARPPLKILAYNVEERTARQGRRGAGVAIRRIQKIVSEPVRTAMATPALPSRGLGSFRGAYR